MFEKYYQAFDTVFYHQINTSKFVKNTPLGVVFSIFLVFHLVIKHCVSCLIYYFKICCYYFFVEVKLAQNVQFVFFLKLSAIHFYSGILCKRPKLFNKQRRSGQAHSRIHLVGTCRKVPLVNNYFLANYFSGLSTVQK